jgi:hypothetical protein
MPLRSCYCFDYLSFRDYLVMRSSSFRSDVRIAGIENFLGTPSKEMSGDLAAGVEWEYLRAWTFL